LDPIEKLTIETPEQIALEFPLAGLGSRALALLFDTLIQLVASLLIFLAVAFIEPDLSAHWITASNWVIALEVFGGFCLYWGYFTLFEAFWNGQTPGKRHAKIRVISDSGRPITVFEAIARNLLRVVDSLGAYLIGCMAIVIDKRNRRLGDMVAGTVVVHEVERQSEQYWYSGERADAPAWGQAVITLTMAEFQLIETFLNRRLDLPPERRQQAAKEISERIATRLSVPAPQRPSDETFLEEVARLFRDHSRYR
jgi:uncharacterized RDD family membrane protein YckC